MELEKSNEHIAGMFDKIAVKYDLLNHLLSFNIDRIWRRKAVNSIFKDMELKHPKVLDLACGTGDLSGLLFKKGVVVTGADISKEMLAIAEKKNESLKEWAKRNTYENDDSCFILPNYIVASAENLVFESSSFDGATIAFGYRNFYDRPKALSEIKKVLRNDGCLAILEFSYPFGFFAKWIFNLYFKYYLPLVGRIVSKDKEAYKYLVRSVIDFPKYEELCIEIENAGFRDVKYRKLSFGIACLYTCKK